MFFRSDKPRQQTSGQAAEIWARQHLESHGLKIVSQNYQISRGEIDLIAQDGNTLVFIEVRLRSSDTFGSAGDSIDYRKQQRIIHTAKHYLQAQGLWDKVNCRFDALCLTKGTDKHQPYHVEWLRDAFSTE